MNKLSKRLGAMAMVLTMTASYVPAVFAEDAGRTDTKNYNLY